MYSSVCYLCCGVVVVVVVVVSMQLYIVVFVVHVGVADVITKFILFNLMHTWIQVLHQTKKNKNGQKSMFLPKEVKCRTVLEKPITCIYGSKH